MRLFGATRQMLGSHRFDHLINGLLPFAIGRRAAWGLQFARLAKEIAIQVDRYPGLATCQPLRLAADRKK